MRLELQVRDDAGVEEAVVEEEPLEPPEGVEEHDEGGQELNPAELEDLYPAGPHRHGLGGRHPHRDAELKVAPPPFSHTACAPENEVVSFLAR